MRKKRNISSLQTIIKQEEETIRDFTRRFGQVVQRVEVYSIDAVLQNFRKGFTQSTPFFCSLSLDSPITMEELYRLSNRYSTLEDNIRAATQTVMISSKPTGNDKPKVGLVKFDMTRTQHGFCGFRLSIIVFGSYSC